MIYKSEVERVWKTQYESLSRKDEPELSETEEESKPPPLAVKKLRREGTWALDGTSPGPSNAAFEAAPSPAFSRGSSIDREASLGPDGNASKVLKIRRMVRISNLTGFRGT